MNMGEIHQFGDLISSIGLVSRMKYTKGLSNVPESEGIYGIVLDNPRRIYVGCTGSSPFSAGLKRRIRTHINDLIHNKHSNKYLQRDFDYFGYRSFSFHILDKEGSEKREKEFVNHFKEMGFFTYNDYRNDCMVEGRKRTKEGENK